MRKTGCSGVKLEGGSEMVETVKYLTSRGIPVLGHVGLMPQSVHASGGFRTHGKSDEEAERIRSDAIGIAEAGAFAIVIEGTVESVARQITADVGVPTIGIGASPACDGSIGWAGRSDGAIRCKEHIWDLMNFQNSRFGNS